MSNKIESTVADFEFECVCGRKHVLAIEALPVAPTLKIRRVHIGPLAFEDILAEKKRRRDERKP